jgi:hypothetical protein
VTTIDAAEAGVQLSDVTTWVNFGVLGVVVLSLITGWLWAKPSVERMIQDRDRVIRERDEAARQRDQMAQVLQDKLLPIIGDFIATTRALLPVLQQVQQLQQMIPILQELIRVSEAESSDARKKRRRPPRP